MLLVQLLLLVHTMYHGVQAEKKCAVVSIWQVISWQAAIKSREKSNHTPVVVCKQSSINPQFSPYARMDLVCGYTCRLFVELYCSQKAFPSASLVSSTYKTVQSVVYVWKV